MLDMFLMGVKVGFFVAAPIGPVVITLMRMGVLERFRGLPLASVLTSLSICVHTGMAFFCRDVIINFVKDYPVGIYLFMGILVLYVAFRAYRSNAKIDIDSTVKVQVWEPALLSIVCPFTTLLILSLILNPELKTQMQCGQAIVAAIGAGCGAWVVYLGFPWILYFLSTTSAKKAVGFLVKASPFIITFYGLQSIHRAVDIAFFGGAV